MMLGIRRVFHKLKLKMVRYDQSGKAKIAFWKDRLRANYFASTYTPAQIQKSMQIAKVFVQHCQDVTSLHELGVGAGRNILYLARARPDVVYSGNDLDRKYCYKFMAPAVKEILQFYEKDTVTFLRGKVTSGETVDAVLVSDHLIHIPPDSIDEVLEYMKVFATKFIIFREGIRKDEMRKDDFWYAHDYSALERGYDIIHEEQCDPVHFSEYLLRVYKRR